jgi:uncharacterized protein (DUF305 family)
MPRSRRPILFLTTVLTAVILSACGASQQAAAPTSAPVAATEAPAAPAPTVATATEAPAAPAATADGGMAGMDHGNMGRDQAQMTPMPAATADAMAGMDHGNMGGMMGEGPYDALFIDSMIMHHEGAITMAQQAQTEAERPEIKQLAEAIITAQEREIAQMQQWRTAWFPDLADTQGMGMDMGTMEVADDPSKPFDQRFIEAMIPHHEGAIMMAKDAQQNAERAEIKQLAGEIITAQEAEIAQMRQWLKEWYGVE